MCIQHEPVYTLQARHLLDKDILRQKLVQIVAQKTKQGQQLITETESEATRSALTVSREKQEEQRVIGK